MHDATTLDLSTTGPPTGRSFLPGCRMRVTVSGSGPRTALLLDDRVPHEPAPATGPWTGAAWGHEARTVQCDLRWASTGSAGLVPFTHDLAAGDRVAALDALGFTDVDVVAIGAGVPQALALAVAAPARVRSLALLDPLVIGPDRTWDDLAGSFDEAMRFARAHGFEGLENALADDPLSSAAGPFGPQLAADPELVGGLSQLGRERYVARVVAFRDGLVLDRTLIGSPRAGRPPLPGARTADPERTASAEVLAAALPIAARGLPVLPHALATWRTVSQFLTTAVRPDPARPIHPKEHRDHARRPPRRHRRDALRRRPSLRRLRRPARRGPVQWTAVPASSCSGRDRPRGGGPCLRDPELFSSAQRVTLDPPEAIEMIEADIDAGLRCWGRPQRWPRPVLHGRRGTVSCVA